MKITIEITNLTESLDGYALAMQIDHSLNVMIHQQPPLGAHASKEWMKFTRTVKTSLDLIETDAVRNYKEAMK